MAKKLVYICPKCNRDLTPYYHLLAGEAIELWQILIYYHEMAHFRKEKEEFEKEKEKLINGFCQYSLKCQCQS